MRVKIIIEAVLNKSLYLSHDSLEQGLQKKQKKLAQTFTLYMNTLALIHWMRKKWNTLIREKWWKYREFILYGNMATFSLAGVLGRAIFSIYPCKGNINVRGYLHRLIEPRVKKSMSRWYIMWISTRSDMTNENWVPNHFVAVLPIEIEYLGNITMEREILIEMRKLEKKLNIRKHPQNCQ